jgi:hypothetical protein
MAQLKARVSYRRHTGADAADELAALSAVYKLVLESYAMKKAARPGGPDDGKEIESVPTTQNYTK